ncbi:TK/FER protein kinase [Aphelenchoides avenae]|nr:TK/FER protein kinase [Aphelenchus avenae]
MASFFNSLLGGGSSSSNPGDNSEAQASNSVHVDPDVILPKQSDEGNSVHQATVSSREPMSREPLQSSCRSIVSAEPTSMTQSQPRSMPAVGINKVDPKLVSENYYHGIMSNDDVKQALKKDGDFLVCIPEEECYGRMKVTLTTLFKGKPRYFIIGKTRQNHFHVTRRGFDSIPLLVNHYMATREPLHDENPIVIKRPIAHPEWVIAHDRVRVVEKIGKGAYGSVYRAYLVRGQEFVEVAVKKLREHADAQRRKLFLQEARTMREYKHDNIIGLIGIACQREPLFIVLEFCKRGSLLKYLRKEKANIGIAARYKFCTEIAAGMRYLEKMKCIHRDVAARNCLLTESLVCKVADFGLSIKDTEQLCDTSNNKMPIKWLAPEILRYRQFSVKSDVWAYGVLLYEVFTDGGEPYGRMTTTELKEKLTGVERFRMDIPAEVPPNITTLMHKCWSEDPQQRPSFKELHKSLKNLRF